MKITLTLDEIIDTLRQAIVVNMGADDDDVDIDDCYFTEIELDLDGDLIDIEFTWKQP